MRADPVFDEIARRARRRPPWYRRRGPLIVLAAGVVVAGSVAFDVGGTTTSSTRAGDLRSFVTTLDADVASCNSSLRDSYAAYAAVVAGQRSELASAKSIIAGDEPNCTPESNTDLYDFATTQAPATLRAYPVQDAADRVDTWAFPDAAAAINDLEALLAHPGDAKARADLTAKVKAMVSLSGSAQRSLDATALALGTRIGRLDLGATSGLQRGGF